MNRIKLLIVALFIVALGTGFLVGMGVYHTTSIVNGKPIIPTTRPARPSLTETLALTHDQSTQIEAIWKEWQTAREAGRQARSDRFLQIQKERDDAVQALLTEPQKVAFDDLQKKYRQQQDQLEEERRQSFQASVDKTKALLTDAQRTKYEDILKNGPPGRGNRGWSGDRGRGPSSRRGTSATQPATAPVQQF